MRQAMAYIAAGIAVGVLSSSVRKAVIAGFCFGVVLKILFSERRCDHE